MELSNQKIAEYYNTTQNHYKNWWKLNEFDVHHYGVWDKETRNFTQFLINNNRVSMRIANVSSSDKVLNAGCGVGGAFFSNKTKGIKVTGISLSGKQITTAKNTATNIGCSDDVEFHVIDYCDTSFESDTFNLVWAFQSMRHAADKHTFLKVCYRVLKRGGRLIISDFFLSPHQSDKNDWVDKWIDTWGGPRLFLKKKSQNTL